MKTHRQCKLKQINKLNTQWHHGSLYYPKDTTSVPSNNRCTQTAKVNGPCNISLYHKNIRRGYPVIIYLYA